MKAIYPALPFALVLAACSSTPPPVVPTPVPTPTARPSPVPLPPRPVGDWRDAPITPGVWTYAMVQDAVSDAPAQPPEFVATFGTDRRSEVFALTCKPTAGRIVFKMMGQAPSAAVTVTTTTTSRPLTATRNARTGWLEVSLSPRDPLLDAIAFSRGRFMVEVAGLPPLYLPSWPEVSRVIEDCR